MGIDTGGIFNDLLNKVFTIFLEKINNNFGGNGSLFIGEYSKIISESVMIEFIEEVKVFH